MIRVSKPIYRRPVVHNPMSGTQYEFFISPSREGVEFVGQAFIRSVTNALPMDGPNAVTLVIDSWSDSIFATEHGEYGPTVITVRDWKLPAPISS